jgi:hypothetical protein
MAPQHRGYFDANASMALDFPGGIADAVMKGKSRLGQPQHGQDFSLPTPQPPLPKRLPAF